LDEHLDVLGRLLLRGQHEEPRHRLWQHQNGLGAEYTKHRLPVELVYSVQCENVAEAFWLEKRVQNWSRKKRGALIRGDFVALPDLAKKDFRRE
jgi:putative endonuclease